jgi:hypothetical protein
VYEDAAHSGSEVEEEGQRKMYMASEEGVEREDSSLLF